MTDIDNDLDLDLDDIDDLPELVVFPDGTHKVSVSMKWDDKNDDKNKKPLIVELKYQEAVELADPNFDHDKLPKVGDIAYNRFDIKHEFGAGAFKKAYSPILRELGKTRSSEWADVKEVDIIVTTKIRKTKNKEDPANPYINMNVLTSSLG